MATASADPVLDCLISDFGGNYVFALDLLEQYRQDPASVETSWRAYFDALAKVAPAGTVAARNPEPGPQARLELPRVVGATLSFFP